MGVGVRSVPHLAEFPTSCAHRTEGTRRTPPGLRLDYPTGEQVPRFFFSVVELTTSTPTLGTRRLRMDWACEYSLHAVAVLGCSCWSESPFCRRCCVVSV